MKENSYIQTDLAIETDIKDEKLKGVKQFSKEINGIIVEYTIISTKEAEKYIGKEMGTYITITIDKPWLIDECEKETAIDVIASFIKEIFTKDKSKVLVVGLGNREMTVDSLGPKCIDKLLVTRHIANTELFLNLCHKETSAIAPGVVGQTGIETYEIVKSTVKAVKPDGVILIDALAARETERLCTTIQLSNRGMSPGAGIGNHRQKIDEKSLGVPCMSIGIPTMVNSSTLVYDALYKAGITEIDENLKKVLDNGKSFFVSMGECDRAVDESADIISNALNIALSK